MGHMTYDKKRLVETDKLLSAREHRERDLYGVVQEMQYLGGKKKCCTP